MTSINTPALFDLIRDFDNLDHRALLEFIVRQDPQVLEVASQNVDLKPALWIKEAMNFISDNQAIQAIKLVRQATGVGLKEAKDVIDVVRNDYVLPDFSISDASKQIIAQFKSFGVKTTKEVSKAVSNMPQYVYIVRESSHICDVYTSETVASKRCDFLESCNPHNEYYVSIFQLQLI